jgi:hypothetical protein
MVSGRIPEMVNEPLQKAYVPPPEKLSFFGGYPYRAYHPIS